MISKIRYFGNDICGSGYFCYRSKAPLNNTHISMNISKGDKISSISKNNIDNEENEFINIDDDLNSSKYIESYNPYNNYFFILGKITFLQKEIRKFLTKNPNSNCLKSRVIKKSNIPNEDKNNTIKYSESPSAVNNSLNKNINNDTQNELNAIYNNFNKESIIKLTTEFGDTFNKTSIISVNDVSFYTNSITILNDDIYDKNVRGNFLYKKKKYKFKGLVKNKKKDGFGTVVWEDGSKLWGIFENNKVNGIAKFYDVSGNYFCGVYHENVPSGYGIYTKEKCYFEGEWYKIYLNGIGIGIWNDDTIYRGEFRKFLKNGIGLYRWPDGTLYKGEWKNNNINGTGVLSFNDGRIYEGEFVDGKLEGIGLFVWPDGKKYIGKYKNDLREGLGIYYVQKEPLIVYGGIWHNGKMHGFGFRLMNDKFNYYLWKNGKKIESLPGKWVYKEYLEKNDLLYEKFYILSEEHILKYIKKYK